MSETNKHTKKIEEFEKRFGKEVAPEDTHNINGEIGYRMSDFLRGFAEEILQQHDKELVERVEGTRCSRFATNGQRGQLEEEVEYQLNKQLDDIINLITNK